MTSRIKLKKQKDVMTKIIISIFLVISISGCAMAPKGNPEALAEYNDNNDPFEPTNRAIFAFNQIIDGLVLKPVAKGYRFVTPQFARDGISNALSNLSSPVVFANDILQGKIKKSGEVLGRLLINSTVGVLGLFDVAKEMGLPPHKEDFGQTLAVWGASEGPFIVLPLFGPSNPRNIVGQTVDYFLDPFGYATTHTNKETLEAAGTVRTGLRVVSKREKMLDPIDDLERNSVDLYIAMRSFYRQYRDGQIKDGKKTEEKDIFEEFDFSDDEAFNFEEDEGSSNEDLAFIEYDL